MLLQEISEKLAPYSDTPRLDAQLLITHASGLSREKMLAFPNIKLNSEQEKKLNHYLARRLAGEPIAYIIGVKEFWSMEFKVTPDTLIPRPETECVVEWILTHFSSKEKLRVVDLGTGSGAIAIALAHERPQWEIHATDQNKKALEIAQYNAEKLGAKNITFFHGNWCQALPDKNYDLIISNPPYVALDDPHLKALHFEPQNALVSGKEGLDDLKIIAEQAQNYLVKGGYLVLEHGHDQSENVQNILNDLGYNDIEAYRDLGGSMRFIVACHPERSEGSE